MNSDLRLVLFDIVRPLEGNGILVIPAANSPLNPRKALDVQLEFLGAAVCEVAPKRRLWLSCKIVSTRSTRLLDQPKMRFQVLFRIRMHYLRSLTNLF